jgi:hypothetical protein
MAGNQLRTEYVIKNVSKKNNRELCDLDIRPKSRSCLLMDLVLIIIRFRGL